MGLVVYTGGTFDLFHAGHAAFLRRCSELGKVVVSLNTDEFIEAYKGKSPVLSYKDRLAVLASCRYVDYCHWDRLGKAGLLQADAVRPRLAG